MSDTSSLVPGPSEPPPADDEAPAAEQVTVRSLDDAQDEALDDAQDEALDDAHVTAHSLDDAQDEALQRVIEHDELHPPHDDVPTSTRDEEP